MWDLDLIFSARTIAASIAAGRAQNAPGKEPVMASIAFTSVGKLIELLNEATAGEDAYVRVLSAIGAGRRSAPREVLFSCRQTEPGNE